MAVRQILIPLWVTLLWVGGLLAAPVSALGQTVPDIDVTQTSSGVLELEDGALTRYLPEYFAKYNAITARDMLRWMPGIGELARDTQGFGQPAKRGFGSSGDQILINGKRMSGKSNTVWDELERIQAKQVAYIEIIRGPVAGLDVRSEGLIFNVVLKEGAGASGSWQAHMWTDGHGIWRADGMVSYSDTIGKVQYQASASYRPYNPNNVLWRNDTLSSPDGVPFEFRNDRRFDNNDEIEFAGKVSTPVKKTGMANLNVRFAELGFASPRTIARFSIDEAGNLNLIGTIHSDNNTDGFEVEVGGDIEIPMGKGKTIGRFIYSRKSFDQFELNINEPINAPSFDQSLELTDQVAQELIFRGGYQWGIAQDQNLDIGGEIAFNSLDKSVSLAINDGGDDGGMLVPVALPTPDAKVKEKRGELYATHFWTVSNKVALETALVLEYSNIGQTGSNVDQSRTFFFAKPRMELRYAPSAADQLRISIERTISQLDFEDFVSNFDDNDDRLDAGNPDLVPEKAWVLEATFEHRLAKDAGLVSLKVFYERIEDFIDRVAITEFVGAPGNIGNAKIYGLELTTSNRLGFIGLDNAVLDVTYTLQKTQARDAFLGTSGPIRYKPTHDVKATFRHDISSIGLSYWIDAAWASKTHETYIRIVGEQKRTMGFRFYVQKTLFAGVSFWLNIRSVNEDTNRFRNYYTPNVSTGVVAFNEARHQWWTSEFIFGLRGVF